MHPGPRVVRSLLTRRPALMRELGLQVFDSVTSDKRSSESYSSPGLTDIEGHVVTLRPATG